jgi:hypothetical protein
VSPRDSPTLQRYDTLPVGLCYQEFRSLVAKRQLGSKEEVGELWRYYKRFSSLRYDPCEPGSSSLERASVDALWCVLGQALGTLRQLSKTLNEKLKARCDHIRGGPLSLGELLRAAVVLVYPLKPIEERRAGLQPLNVHLRFSVGASYVDVSITRPKGRNPRKPAYLVAVKLVESASSEGPKTVEEATRRVQGHGLVPYLASALGHTTDVLSTDVGSPSVDLPSAVRAWKRRGLPRVEVTTTASTYVSNLVRSLEVPWSGDFILSGTSTTTYGSPSLEVAELVCVSRRLEALFHGLDPEDSYFYTKYAASIDDSREELLEDLEMMWVDYQRWIEVCTAL